MTARGGARSAADVRRVERAIEERVRAGAPAWFPELGSSPQVVLSRLSTRPRCSLYVVRLTDGQAARAVVAKARRNQAGDRRAAARPRLRTVAATVTELTELEYEGLTTIHAAIGAGHPSFGTVRPLDHLADEHVVVMDYVSAPTLRDGFLAESRLSTRRRNARRRVPPSAAWGRAGAWLDLFHGQVVDAAKPARQSRRPEVAERFHAYGEFLAGRLGAASIRGIAATGARFAAELLPEQLPLCVGHGDYAARNMFVDEAGRISVFDPMPRWRVPRLEDVCRFVVGLRLSELQVRSHGAAYARRELDHREDLFLSGYFGASQIPYAQVRCYQLLVLLDKWSAFVDSAGGGGWWRAGANTVLSRPGNAYFAREARRLVALLGRTAG